MTRIQNEIVDKIAAIPGVTSVGISAGLPMEGIDPNWDEMGVEGKHYEGGEPPLRLFNFVSPGYFHTLGTRIVAGRDFTWSDIYDFNQYVMVSENFARENWGSAGAAVGKRVRQFSSMPWQVVIGVVQDVRHNGVDEKAPAIIYWPAMIYSPYTRERTIEPPRAVSYAIRSNRAGNESLVADIQRAVWSIDGNLPVANASTMQEIYARSMERTSFTLAMLAIAGAMALGARHHRHLRSHLLRRLAAHPRNRHPPRTWCAEEGTALDVRAIGTHSHGDRSRNRHRRCGCAYSDL